MDCGTNATASLSVPPETVVYYFVALNISGGSANIWNSIGNSYGFALISAGGYLNGSVPTGLGGTLGFVLPGCGDTPTVALGLWGFYNTT